MQNEQTITDDLQTGECSVAQNSFFQSLWKSLTKFAQVDAIDFIPAESSKAEIAIPEAAPVPAKPMK